MAKNLKTFLKEFNNLNVTVMTDQDRRRNVDTVNSTILKDFINCMKDADPLFKELYQKIYYTGSFYEGLKVKAANEFDLNIVLKLPFKLQEIQVVHNTAPGFVKYQLTQPLECLLARHPKWETFKALDKIMDPTHKYLSQKNLNCWLQSVVDRALQTNQAKFPNVKRSCSGPAKTLKISSINGTAVVLDIDLVPVVELNDFPGSVRISPEIQSALPRDKRTCFIVPKPPPAHIVAKYKNDEDKLFRVSLPDAERFLMENKGCVKMLIKIFKAIRDKDNLNFFSSYYIKSVFLGQLAKHPQADYWKEDNLDKLFIMMLKEFIMAMDKKSITHIFFNNFNLIAGLPQGAFGTAKTKFESLLRLAESDVPKLYVTYVRTV